MAATPAEIQKKLKELAKKFATQRQELSKARAGLAEAEKDIESIESEKEE